MKITIKHVDENGVVTHLQPVSDGLRVREIVGTILGLLAVVTVAILLGLFLSYQIARGQVQPYDGMIIGTPQEYSVSEPLVLPAEDAEGLEWLVYNPQANTTCPRAPLRAFNQVEMIDPFKPCDVLTLGNEVQVFKHE